jgi:peptidyl-prolyl cis-trans isomerase B (cyclophilin B)
MKRLVAIVCLALLVSPSVLRAQEPPPAPDPHAPPVQAVPTLDELAKEWIALEPAERDYWAFMNGIYVEERELIKFSGLVQESRERAVKNPQDKDLTKEADEVEHEFQAKIAKHQGRRNEYETRSTEFYGKLKKLLDRINALRQKDPDEPNVRLFHARFLAEHGGWADLVAPSPEMVHPRLPDDEPEAIYRALPADLEARALYGESRMVLAFDPRRNHEPRPPLLDKAYEALAPVAKGEVKTAAGKALYADDPVRHDGLELTFGVAACALGKNEEAKLALDSIAVLGSVRPAYCTIIGIPNDPDAAFTIWRDCARGLSSNPNDLALRRKRAELLLGIHAAPLAIPDAQAVAKGSPDDRGALLLLARATTEANQFEKACDVYKQLVEKLPKEETKAEPEKRYPGASDASDADVANDSPEVIRGEYAMALFCANRMAEAKEAFAAVGDTKKLGPQLVQRLRTYKPETLAEKWVEEQKARESDAKKGDNPVVVLETERGAITLELFEDTAPNTVANFLYLGENGFYNGTCFHRVLPGFMAQGGDPTGSGLGSCGWNVKDELASNPRLHWRGTLSMANTGRPDTGNSQFFICHEPTPHLNGKHTVFGRVTAGQEIVDALEVRDVIKKFTVVGKRSHDYKPEEIPVPGLTAWKPGEPRLGEKKKPSQETKKDGQ